MPSQFIDFYTDIGTLFVKTTLNIRDALLAEAKVVAAQQRRITEYWPRTHRTVGK